MTINVTNVVKSTSKIKRVQKVGRENVYDFTVDETHRINAGGFYTSNCNHPEVETFINIKRDLKKVTGANVSIRITDDFMQAVKDDAEFTLQWPVDVPLSEAKVTRTVKAKDVWDQIVDSAWTSAEPGVLFWDTITRRTPSEAYASKGFAASAVNPCAELILSPYDSCRLLLLNLANFVIDPFLPTARWDAVRFREAVGVAQRLMDDLVDLELEAVDKIIEKVSADKESSHVKRIELELWQKIRQSAQDGRRTGLGITALGDALAYLGLRYGSPESVSMTEEIYKQLAVGAYETSIEMAAERGCFPAFDHGLEKENEFLAQVLDGVSKKHRSLYDQVGRRNIALTTTAPAGSVSCLTRTTSGCEPAFLLSYKRRKKINPNDVNTKVDFVDALGDRWTEFDVYHHGFKKWMDVTGKTNPEESPYWKSTSADVDWAAGVKLQAAAQKWICHSLSKTCNLPADASKEVVSQVYMTAWESGCKGFTVYRDGSRSGVLVASEEKKETTPSSDAEDGQKLTENHAPRRPKDLPCEVHRINVRSPEGPETYLVLVGLLNGAPYEVFCGLSQHVEIPKKVKSGTLSKNGKKDGVATYNLRIPMGDEEMVFKDVVNLFDNPRHGAFTRTLSLALRHGVPVNYVCEQLQKDKHSDMQSFSRVIARTLKKYIPEGTKSASDKKCDSCGAEDGLIYQEGCLLCKNCGTSKCGLSTDVTLYTSRRKTCLLDRELSRKTTREASRNTR